MRETRGKYPLISSSFNVLHYEAMAARVLSRSDLRLHRDLVAHFHHPPGRDLKVVGGVAGRARQSDEQAVLPTRHAGVRGGKIGGAHG